jgi:hypothetical protein
MNKVIVIGIIALFIGVGIQPVISNEVTIPQTFDSEEDCDCQSNGKTHLAEKLLNRLEKNEVFTNIIESGNSAYDRPICELLLKWALYYNDLGWYYLYSGHYFMGKIYLGISLYIYEAGVLLLCWPFIP